MSAVSPKVDVQFYSCVEKASLDFLFMELSLSVLSHMCFLYCQIADMEKFTEYIADQELIMTDAISEPNKSQKKVQVLRRESLEVLLCLNHDSCLEGKTGVIFIIGAVPPTFWLLCTQEIWARALTG
jgi:hypothetical protein